MAQSQRRGRATAGWAGRLAFAGLLAAVAAATAVFVVRYAPAPARLAASPPQGLADAPARTMDKHETGPKDSSRLTGRASRPADTPARQQSQSDKPGDDDAAPLPAGDDWDAELALMIPQPSLAERPADRQETTFTVPEPRLARPTPGRTLPRFEAARKARTQLVALENAPFPYTGTVPGTDRAFLDVSQDGRRGHRTPSGRVYWQDTHYSDRRSLVHIPAGFDVTNPGVLVLFFHGHGATLERDVWQRQRLPRQITGSGMNAVLVAPQFGVDARDSSIGRFWQPGALRRYLDEVANELARLYGNPAAARHFREMPILIAGYSGGYLPTAYGLARGGIASRIRGVMLLDGLYGHLGTFANWLGRAQPAFFVSSYAGSTRRGNAALMERLERRGLDYATELPPRLGSGDIVFLREMRSHRSYVTDAWTRDPVSDILRRMDGLARRPAPSLAGRALPRDGRGAGGELIRTTAVQRAR